MAKITTQETHNGKKIKRKKLYMANYLDKVGSALKNRILSSDANKPRPRGGRPPISSFADVGGARAFLSGGHLGSEPDSSIPERWHGLNDEELKGWQGIEDIMKDSGADVNQYTGPSFGKFLDIFKDANQGLNPGGGNIIQDIIKGIHSGVAPKPRAHDSIDNITKQWEASQAVKNMQQDEENLLRGLVQDIPGYDYKKHLSSLEYFKRNK